MNKEFATYKQALALKELGFDEPCLAGYQLQKATLFSDIPHTLNGNIHKNSEGSFTCAPLYQQAFRWLYLKLDIKNGTMPLDKEAQESLLKELIDKFSSKHLLV